MIHCSSKSIHVLNNSTTITNINVKGALSFVKLYKSVLINLYELFLQLMTHCDIKSEHVLNTKYFHIVKCKKIQKTLLFGLHTL